MFRRQDVSEFHNTHTPHEPKCWVVEKKVSWEGRTSVNFTQSLLLRGLCTCSMSVNFHNNLSHCFSEVYRLSLLCALVRFSLLARQLAPHFYLQISPYIVHKNDPIQQQWRRNPPLPPPDSTQQETHQMATRVINLHLITRETPPSQQEVSRNRRSWRNTLKETYTWHMIAYYVSWLWWLSQSNIYTPHCDAWSVHKQQIWEKRRPFTPYTRI